jgi:hypothetical protein
MKVLIEERSAPSDNYGYANAVLRAMQEMTAKGIEDSNVKTIAKKLQGKTDLDTLRNDWTYLKRRVRYTPDPPDKERITSARFTIGHGVPEDCDGLSVAAASLFALQDIPADFAAIAWRKPEFSHVYVTARVNNKAVPFDLTLPNLGDEHKYHTILKAPIMPTIQTISDSATGTLSMPQIYAALYSPDRVMQKMAYNEFKRKYPAKAVAWLQAQAQELALGNGRGISDYFGDDIVSSVLSAVTGGASSVASWVGGAVSSLFSSAPVNPDPNRPGRSLFDARTYMDELTDIYPSNRSALGTESIDANYSVVIHVPPSQLPTIDQDLKGKYPGLIFLSWDGKTSWISDFDSINAAPVGAGYVLSGQLGGQMKSFPGYYVRTHFSNGADRFDFVGMSPSDIPGTGDKQANAQLQNSTSVAASAGTTLPAKKISTVGTTGGVMVPTGGSTGGGKTVTTPVDTTINTPYGPVKVPAGTTVTMPGTKTPMNMKTAALIGGGVVAVGLLIGLAAKKR